MGPKSEGLVNRDYDACLNMIEIVKSLIKPQKRPKWFERKKKEQKPEPKEVK